MRKLFVNPVILLTIIASLLFVSSCKTEGEINEADLIGIWNIGDSSVDIKVGPLSLTQFLKVTMMLPDEAAQAIVDQLTAEFADIGGGTITFNEDYSYAMLKGDLGEEGSWELEGDKLHLTITGETPGDPLTLRNLSSSAALVAWEEEHVVNINDLPEFTATIIFELNLSK
ncbi:MAG: hypothetical protein E4H10_01690 [Bacteroidia bacterium]|nr:MAG: hypothetical protein E4H10_01690 [Bacteroidia bacterium]